MFNSQEDPSWHDWKIIDWYVKNQNKQKQYRLTKRKHGSVVVECLIQDWRAEGSSLTGVTALWSLSKTHLSWLSTGSTQEDPSLYNWKIVDGT